MSRAWKVERKIQKALAKLKLKRDIYLFWEKSLQLLGAEYVRSMKLLRTKKLLTNENKQDYVASEMVKIVAVLDVMKVKLPYGASGVPNAEAEGSVHKTFRNAIMKFRSYCNAMIGYCNNHQFPRGSKYL